MFRTAQELLPPDMPFSIYEALLKEHIDKVFTFLPQHTQTGPAIRGDKTTIEKHLTALTNQKAIQKMYLSISQLINPDLQL